MTQKERLQYLIQYLIRENRSYASLTVPDSEQERKKLLRSLVNVRPPVPASQKFLSMQDAYLSEERDKKRLVSIGELSPVQKNLYIWQGDITTLRTDAIVNAANSALLGCFIPCHGCIDNAIHTAAGIQLRMECHTLMEEQGREEPAGQVKVTKAYNLPCRYVFHTVGPVITGKVHPEDSRLLADCYTACLEAASAHRLDSIAFCCISTGEFHFPNEEAAQTAIATVRTYLEKTGYKMKVVFNVFKDQDYEIYRRLLQ